MLNYFINRSRWNIICKSNAIHLAFYWAEYINPSALLNRKDDICRIFLIYEASFTAIWAIRACLHSNAAQLCVSVCWSLRSVPSQPLCLARAWLPLIGSGEIEAKCYMPNKIRLILYGCKFLHVSSEAYDLRRDTFLWFLLLRENLPTSRTKICTLSNAATFGLFVQRGGVYPEGGCGEAAAGGGWEGPPGWDPGPASQGKADLSVTWDLVCAPVALWGSCQLGERDFKKEEWPLICGC